MRGRTTAWFSHWLSQLLSGSLLHTTIMSVSLFCHGRAEWTYTVLALRGQIMHASSVFVLCPGS